MGSLVDREGEEEEEEEALKPPPGEKWGQVCQVGSEEEKGIAFYSRCAVLPFLFPEKGEFYLRCTVFCPLLHYTVCTTRV